MPLSTVVNLPKNHAARFPDKCVVCGTESPGQWIRLMTASIGWWTWVLWAFGKPFIVKAPACKGCRTRLHLQRSANLLITLGLAAVAMLLINRFLPEDLSRGTRKIIYMGSALICVSPLILYEVFFPMAFDVTARKDNVDYDFRDEAYAIEFAQLNDDADWVRIE